MKLWFSLIQCSEINLLEVENEANHIKPHSTISFFLLRGIQSVSVEMTPWSCQSILDTDSLLL